MTKKITIFQKTLKNPLFSQDMENERPKIVDIEEELRWHEIEFLEPSIVEIPEGDRLFHRVNYHLPHGYVLELVGIRLDKGRNAIKDSDTYRSGSITSPPFQTEGGLVLMAQGIAEDHGVGFLQVPTEKREVFYASDEAPKAVVAGLVPVTLAYESFQRGREGYMGHLKTFWR